MKLRVTPAAVCRNAPLEIEHCFSRAERRCAGIAWHMLSTYPALKSGSASVHGSIFHQLAVMEDTVGEELAAGFEIEAELHASRVGSRRGGAGLATRTMIQHIVKLKKIASAACAYFVLKRQRLSVDELIAAVENVRVKPYVLRVGSVSYPCAELYVRLQFRSGGSGWDELVALLFDREGKRVHHVAIRLRALARRYGLRGRIRLDGEHVVVPEAAVPSLGRLTEMGVANVE